MASGAQDTATTDCSFKDQTVLITGAASGIGRATFETLYARGANVIGVDVVDSTPDLAKQARELYEPVSPKQSVVAEKIDISEEGALEAVLNEVIGDCHSIKALDAVVHCAAITLGGTALTIPLEDWHRTLEVNLTGAILVAKATLPRLIESRGSLVLVASQLGMAGTNNSIAYTASKGGVINLMRSLALDHGPQGVRINCLCPGPTDTPFLERSFTRASNPESARAASLSKVPLGRFGTTQEVANGAAFLASHESSFVHGTTLVVDGGYLAS